MERRRTLPRTWRAGVGRDRSERHARGGNQAYPALRSGPHPGSAQGQVAGADQLNPARPIPSAPRHSSRVQSVETRIRKAEFRRSEAER